MYVCLIYFCSLYWPIIPYFEEKLIFIDVTCFGNLWLDEYLGIGLVLFQPTFHALRLSFWRGRPCQEALDDEAACGERICGELRFPR